MQRSNERVRLAQERSEESPIVLADAADTLVSIDKSLCPFHLPRAIAVNEMREVFHADIVRGVVEVYQLMMAMFVHN